MKEILWKGGASAKSDAYIGEKGEIAIDTTYHRIRVHDGTTAGGTALALKSDLPTKLSQLTDDVGVWAKGAITALSQLTDDVGFWKRADLTKISQLTNDSGFQTGHCSYCSHCTYCNQCNNCYDCTTINCTTVNCTTVNCTTVQCSVYGYCTYCKDCNCYCQCTDDN